MQDLVSQQDMIFRLAPRPVPERTRCVYPDYSTGSLLHMLGHFHLAHHHVT